MTNVAIANVFAGLGKRNKINNDWKRIAPMMSQRNRLRILHSREKYMCVKRSFHVERNPPPLWRKGGGEVPAESNVLGHCHSNGSRGGCQETDNELGKVRRSTKKKLA